ncbi:MAG: FtsQ-type POTRA domain-containing protein [Mollicutes bacterium]|nr:FtsQ-type POTRA domain-containing protein [Mollicutes bacterium]
MKKRVRRKFNFGKFILFILIIFIIYFGMKYLFSIKIKNIIIVNNNYYSDEEIIEKAGIENYPEFITLSRKKIKNKLSTLDLIEDVEIKKEFGFILRITIKEKKILYHIRSNNEYKVSDNKNYSLDNVTGVPTLINYVPEEVEKKFVNKFKDIDSNIINMISEIEYNKTSYDSERFLLYMNDGNEVYITSKRTNLLNKYLEIVTKLDNKKGILYLDSGNYFEIKK